MEAVQDVAKHGGAVLTDAEIKEVSGGYTWASKQLDVLHARGYWRATRSKLTGHVILERAHFEAVNRGEDLRKATPTKSEDGEALFKWSKAPA